MSVAFRYERAMWSLPHDLELELGLGIEVGASGGSEPLQRGALLPGIALARTIGSLTWRIEEQIGPQVVRGRLSIGPIPLRGTETRSFHDELALAVDVPITDVVDLRIRAGLQIDGIYPAGHASTFVGPIVGVAAVVRP